MLCVRYACKRDSSCSCILGVGLGSVDLNPLQSLRPLPPPIFYSPGACLFHLPGPSASATISARGSLPPAFIQRYAGRLPFNAILSIAALDVACSAWYVMRAQTWGPRSERLEKWGSTERILLAVFRGRRFGAATGRAAPFAS